MFALIATILFCLIVIVIVMAWPKNISESTKPFTNIWDLSPKEFIAHVDTLDLTDVGRTSMLMMYTENASTAK